MLSRESALQALAREPFDVVVIGDGITGATCASVSDTITK